MMKGIKNFRADHPITNLEYDANNKSDSNMVGFGSAETTWRVTIRIKI